MRCISNSDWRSVRRGLVPMFLLLLWTLSSVPVSANPLGENVVAGSAGFSRDGNTLTIQQGSDRVIINWQDFSIGANELTKFMQPSATSAALNRVISGNPSSILGALQANGQVYLINPNGILVGAGARIDCGSFIASTLDIGNDAFMAGGNLTFMGNSTASIQNLGAINALGGDVFMIAQQVENRGTIMAPNGVVGLAAGTEVLLTQGGDQRLAVQPSTSNVQLPTSGKPNGIVNAGLVESAQAELKANGNIYAFAINNEGVIRATGVVEKNGRVLLTAPGGTILNSGTVTAKNADGTGGSIQANASWVGQGGTLKASGTTGGAVAIRTGGYSNAGQIQATGTTGRGGDVMIAVDGTSVETSSGSVDVSGASGGTISHVAGLQITSSGAYLAVGTGLPAIGQDSALGNGGRIAITAPAVKLLSATLDASGTGNGGVIWVGGEFQGGKGLVVDELPNAQLLAISSGTSIKADGGVTSDPSSVTSGNGGTVVLWSDLQSAVYADISAKGGSLGKAASWRFPPATP